MWLYDFVSKYYLEPIKYDSGYNIVNTVTYALVFFLVVYGIYVYINKLKMSIDFKFLLSLLPFAFLGAVFRAFVDHKIYTSSFWTITPGLYLIIISAWLASVSISFYFRKQEYWKFACISGIIFAVVNILVVANKLGFGNVGYGLAMLGLAIFTSVILYFTFKLAKQKWATKRLSFAPFAAHLLDASATFIAVDFLAGMEKHPLPRYLSEVFHTAAIMYPLKLIVLIPAVYVLMQVEDKQLRNTFLVAITALGFAQGIRDLLTMVLV